MVHIRWSVAAVLLQLSSAVLSHGHDEHAGESTDGMKMGAAHSTLPADGEEWRNWYTMDSYSSTSEHSRMVVAHIIFTVLAWFFVLPIGKC
jgi:hypothetical protein